MSDVKGRRTGNHRGSGIGTQTMISYRDGIIANLIRSEKEGVEAFTMVLKMHNPEKLWPHIKRQPI
jgi:hypothetical protein